MKNYLILVLLFFNSIAWSQESGKTVSKKSYSQFNGRILDSATGKGIDAASIQFYFLDTLANNKNISKIVLGGQLTKSNGRFDVDSISITSSLFFKITAIGYQSKELKIKPSQLQKSTTSSLDGVIRIELGDIKLLVDPRLLDEILVKGEKPFMQLAADRRIFNIGRDILSTGLMATDLMRNIPGLEVDVEGRVTLRNATPTFFVDGRPTMLTLDQIPADAVQRVEIITNPSAKFDASSGMAGILNIVLKKNKKPGYNGNLRTGIDSRAQVNLGGDININQGKINFFANASINQQKLIGENISHRENRGAMPLIYLDQTSHPLSTGYSAFASGGFDWFVNKLNTLTFSGNIVRGKFDNTDLLKSTLDTIQYQKSYTERNQFNNSLYKNVGIAIGHKKLFNKKGMELTSDFSFNSNFNNSNNNFVTKYFDQNYRKTGNILRQTQNGDGQNSLIAFQTDFVNPLGEKNKFEMGARASYRKVQNDNLNFVQDQITGQFIPVVMFNANFKYDDRVLAAYSTYSGFLGSKLSYQMGLRIESSKYNGKTLNDNSTFFNNYPLSLFPSSFLNYKISNNQNLQFSYSRKVGRPNFFQLMPFYDYLDSLNIQRGNPGLKPEFTNSLEMNYSKNLKKRQTLMFSIYYKHTTNLISRYQIKEANPSSNTSSLVNTYVNASSAHAYGLEASARNPVNKWLEFSSTVTFYNSGINGTNLSKDLSNNLWSFTARVNTTFKFSNNWNMQINSNYRSRTMLPRGSTDVIVGGGSSFGAFVQTTVQGYVDAVYGIDFAVRKEFMKEKRASLSLSVSDILRSRVNSIHIESPFFIQDVRRRRDWQVFRLNFTWRFGKYNTSLFKRKNQRSGSEGIQEGMQQMQ